MIPFVDVLTQENTDAVYASRTYKVKIDLNRIDGYTNDIDSVIQAIYLILNTERYKYIIYSWDYGIELVDLIGQPTDYVIAEIPRRVKDALIQDNRISDVVDFEFTIADKKLHTTFTVVTDVGNISTELEVSV